MRLRDWHLQLGEQSDQEASLLKYISTGLLDFLAAGMCLRACTTPASEMPKLARRIKPLAASVVCDVLATATVDSDRT